MSQMYISHSDSLCHPPLPTRRVVSMPTIRVPFAAPSTPVLPLSLPPTNPNSNTAQGRIRSTSRRLNYKFKSRAGHYSLPLALGSICALLLFFYHSNHISLPSTSTTARIRLHTRSTEPITASPSNGISILLSEEDELIAEDDLFWDKYTDPEPLSEEQKTVIAEMTAHRLDVQEHDRQHALRALIWWLAEGGIIPDEFEVPTHSYLKKAGGRGMERLLEDIQNGAENDEIFAEGWGEYANSMYRTVVFSKVSILLVTVKFRVMTIR